MAIIKPFRGLRYNQDIITDVSAVVTPPYDVISPQEQERYYQMHPNNIIRLDLGKSYPAIRKMKINIPAPRKYSIPGRKMGC